MDEVFLDAPGIDKARLKSLSTRSDRKGVAQLAGHGAALAGSTGLIAWAMGGPLLLPALVLQGLVLIFLFAPLHESVHRTAFRSRRLNDTVAQLCGFLLLLPAGYFRSFHFAHHRFTQDPRRDPELSRPKPQTVSEYLLHVSGLPYWRERVTTIPKHARGKVDEGFIAPHQRPAIIAEARTYCALYGAVAVLSAIAADGTALLYWLVPAAIGQPALRLYLLAEHTGCPLVPDMLRNSRTTHTTVLLRRLAWNMPYHAEHHAYPALPFHALPRAHDLLRERIAVQAPGYMAAHREIVTGLTPRRSLPIGR